MIASRRLKDLVSAHRIEHGGSQPGSLLNTYSTSPRCIGHAWRLRGQVERSSMEAKWNLCVLRPYSLRMFSFSAHDQAFLAAYGQVEDRCEFSIESPQGIRIEQQEILEWCHNHFEQLKKAA